MHKMHKRHKRCIGDGLQLLIKAVQKDKEHVGLCSATEDLRVYSPSILIQGGMIEDGSD